MSSTVNTDKWDEQVFQIGKTVDPRSVAGSCVVVRVRSIAIQCSLTRFPRHSQALSMLGLVDCVHFLHPFRSVVG
jgi:hypothetical protein